MNNLKLLFFSLFTLIGSFTLNSQKNLNNQPGLVLEHNSISQEQKDPLKEIEGSFQFQISKIDHKVMLYPDLASFIEFSRKEEEDVFIRIDEFVTLYIPATKKVKMFGFVYLPMFYYPTK